MALQSNSTNSTVVPTTVSSNDEAQPDNTSKFLVSLLINVVVAIIVLLVFSYLRPKLKIIYAPRQQLLDAMFPLGKLPSSFLAWIMPAFMVHDEDVLRYSGMDALVYLRFMKLCFKISLVIMPYGIAVLLPLNYFGKGDQSGLDELSMSNVKEESPNLWAHLLAVWAYTLAICYFMYEEWKAYVVFRQEFLSKGNHAQFVVMMRDLPAKYQDEDSVKTFAEELFSGQVEDVIIVEDLSKWKKLVYQHDEIFQNLEHARAVFGLTGERPVHSSRPCGTKEDSIACYENKLLDIQTKLEKEMESKNDVFPTALVVFRTVKSAAVAGQVMWDSSPLTIDVFPAPEVSETIWQNLKVGLMQRKVRVLLVYVAVFALVVFWTIPVSFVSALFTLSNLTERFPFLEGILDMGPFVKGLLEGFLGSLALLIFFTILPMITYKLSELQGLVSCSEVERSSLGKLYVFVVVNQFLFLAAGATVLTKIDDIIHSPTDIPNFLASTLPSQGVVFMCYAILKCFIGFSLELLRLVPLILVSIKRKWLVKTKREDLASWEPPPVAYDRVFTDHLFMFTVGLSYSVLAPLITPLVVAYFGFGCIVWTYQILCVYIPKYDGGGLVWPKLFNRMIVSLLVFQLLMVGMMTLKKHFLISMLVLPLPVITILFFLFVQQHYLRSSTYLSLNTCFGMSEASPNVLQEVAKAYIQGNRIVPMTELKDKTTDEDELLDSVEPHTTDNTALTEFGDPVV